MTRFTRRGFLAASAAMGATLSAGLVPARARAASPLTLAARTRVIEVGGRAATVFGITNGTGGQGVILDPGAPFRVDLTNALDEETILHWHGQIPPNDQDGVPNTNPMLAPGETRSYDFTPRPGTFWMHSHVTAQEVGLMAAPLIVRRPEDVAADRQEVVMFLHDFSFTPAEEVLAQVTGGSGGHDAHTMGQGGMDHGTMTGMSHGSMTGSMSGAMSGMSGMTGMSGMSGMAMDLNDYDFDAYLANDRTLDDPEVVAVDRGARVLLRIINGSAMTAYWIDTGAVPGRLLAVDGDPVAPLEAHRFPIASGQRLEVELQMPADGGALPVLALREGARERTGLILAPSGATVTRIAGLAEETAPPVAGDLSQEALLRALSPLPDRPVEVRRMVMLGGSMDPYLWTIDGATWADRTPVEVPSGARVELTFHNMSMMAHPMHLHGHVFQVVALGNRRIPGAMRDTVFVPAMGAVTIAFDAGEAAPWLLHCHHMGHMQSGMMTELRVTA